MPLFMSIYLTVFGVLLLSNLVFWIRNKGRFLMMLYELLSGLAMMAFAAAYWVDEIRCSLNVASVAAYVSIVMFDFCFSVFGRSSDLGLELGGGEERDVETAKALSVLFAAPAYVAGALVCFDLLREKFLGC